MSVRLEPLVPESPEREETHLSDGNRLTVVLIIGCFPNIVKFVKSKQVTSYADADWPTSIRELLCGATPDPDPILAWLKHTRSKPHSRPGVSSSLPYALPDALVPSEISTAP
jgi:hypothetical protein